MSQPQREPVVRLKARRIIRRDINRLGLVAPPAATVMAGSKRSLADDNDESAKSDCENSLPTKKTCTKKPAGLMAPVPVAAYHLAVQQQRQEIQSLKDQLQAEKCQKEFLEQASLNKDKKISMVWPLPLFHLGLKFIDP